MSWNMGWYWVVFMDGWISKLLPRWNPDFHKMGSSNFHIINGVLDHMLPSSKAEPSMSNSLSLKTNVVSCRLQRDESLSFQSGSGLFIIRICNSASSFTKTQFFFLLNQGSFKFLSHYWHFIASSYTCTAVLTVKRNLTGRWLFLSDLLLCSGWISPCTLAA